MGKELLRVCEESVARCKAITEAMKKDTTHGEYMSLLSLWHQHYNRLCAAGKALVDNQQMVWTTAGDFSHLQSTPGVRF